MLFISDKGCEQSHVISYTENHPSCCCFGWSDGDQTSSFKDKWTKLGQYIYIYIYSTYICIPTPNCIKLSFKTSKLWQATSSPIEHHTPTAARSNVVWSLIVQLLLHCTPHLHCNIPDCSENISSMKLMKSQAKSFAWNRENSISKRSHSFVNISID